MKFILIVPLLFLCTFVPRLTTAWTNPISIDIMSTVSSYLPYYRDQIPQFFPNIMQVAELYGTITNYTTYGCPLKWMIRTRGGYIPYYTQIQQRINETRDRVLANYTFWSTNFNQTGDSLDQGLAKIQEVLTKNNCSAEFVDEYLQMLKINLTIIIVHANDLQYYYQLMTLAIPAGLPYAFPTELIKALQRKSIMSFGDLGIAVHLAEFLRYFEDRRFIYEALDIIEWAMDSFNYHVFYNTRKAVEKALDRALLQAIRFPCVNAPMNYMY